MRAAIIASILTLAGTPAFASCADSEIGRALDFWLGDWTVHAGGEQVGTNAIRSELKSCAIFEHWRNSRGGEGKSLFYFDGIAMNWRQVWVTEDTRRPGGLKHKQLVDFADGMVRFSGTLEHPTRGEYLDQTTLTRQPDGNVRQLIEISFDDGATWQTTFDALYKRPETP